MRRAPRIAIRNWSSTAAASFLAASLVFATPAISTDDLAGQPKWHPWFELGGAYNNDDASRGEMTVFAPIVQSGRTLLFVDGRGKFFEEDVQEGNLALGYREMMTSGFNLGVWIGGDVRSTSLDNTFWQLSGGFEALSHNFDARLNWYGPVTEPQAGAPGFTEVTLRGNNIVMIGGEEVGLHGIDGELGFRVPLEILDIGTSNMDLRVYGGGFYFDHEDALQEVAGGKARAELRINDVIPEFSGSRLTFNYEFSYDDVRERRHEVGARLRIPFSQRETRVASLSAQELRMMDRVERDIDIVTTQSKEENVEDALTNVDFDRVAFVNNGGSITNTSTAASNNALVIVNGAINGAQVVQENQTVQGGGSTIRVRGVRSGTVASFTAPGARPTVFSNVNAAIVGITGNNHVAGLDIAGGGFGGGNVGISGAGSLGNVAVTQNTISQTGGTGISITNFTGPGPRNLTITHNTVSQAGADGIRAGFSGTGTGTLTLNYNTVSQAALDGIQVTNFNDGTLSSEIMHNRVSNSGADGMRFDFQNNTVNTINIARNTIVGSASDGMEFDLENNSRTSGAVSNNTIDGTTFGEGIEIDQDQASFASLMISGNTITSFADPLDIDLDNNSIGFYRVIGNTFASAQPASIIDIDTNDNANLSAQVARNTTNVNFDFDEDGASTFRLENTLGTNTFLGGAILVIDPAIDIVTTGTLFPAP